MKKSIYKITNKLNNRIYIGQSNDPMRRFSEHCHKSENYTSLINEAIQKYGVENFCFEVIESDIENYNEREKYWIKYYNSLAPNGYNIAEGGEEPPRIAHTEHHWTTHNEDTVKEVKRLLRETTLSPSEIGERTGYNPSAVNRINLGKIWNDPNEIYPIRVLFDSDMAQKERWEQIVELLQTTDFTQKEIATLCGVKRSAVTMINNGRNGRRWNDGSITYPIRSGRHCSNNL